MRYLYNVYIILELRLYLRKYRTLFRKNIFVLQTFFPDLRKSNTNLSLFSTRYKLFYLFLLLFSLFPILPLLRISICYSLFLSSPLLTDCPPFLLSVMAYIARVFVIICQIARTVFR